MDESDDDNLEEDESREEITNMYFMAIENGVNFNENFSYDDLSIMLIDKFEKLDLNRYIPKKKHSWLKNEVKNFGSSKRSWKKFITVFFIKDISSSKEKIVDLIKIVYKFTQSMKNVDLMLGKQKCVFDEGGIRYNLYWNKSLSNLFVKASYYFLSNITCGFVIHMGM